MSEPRSIDVTVRAGCLVLEVANHGHSLAFEISLSGDEAARLGALLTKLAHAYPHGHSYTFNPLSGQYEPPDSIELPEE